MVAAVSADKQHAAADSISSVPAGPHPQKRRKGLIRLYYATGYSLAGLFSAFRESPAFRLEACLNLLALPVACLLGRSWMEVVILWVATWQLLIVELLNSGIEAVTDRVGYELHPLSKQAKDFGSAAVFLSTLTAIGTWGAFAWSRWMPA